MSYRLFGSISLKGCENYESLSKIGLEMERLAIEQGMFLLMGHCLKSKEIDEMLEKVIDDPKSRLSFCVTDSPVRDTSDELLEPPLYKEGDREYNQESIERLRGKTERIGKLFDEILKLDEVTDVVLVTTVHYDVESKEHEATPSRLAEILFRECKEGDLPSMKFTFSKS